MTTLTKAAMRSERRDPRDFVDCEGLDLPDAARAVLLDFSREKALSLLEDPPINPIDFHFDPLCHDTTKYPLAFPSGTVLQLLEVLLACGHAPWVAAQLSHRHPRLSVVAALSRHPLLSEAAARALSVPSLEGLIARVAKKRHTVADLTALADAGAAYSPFRRALSDAIRTYTLTCDVSDSLIEPLAWFEGFDRASPGKLCYFFIRAPDDYPIFDALWKNWAFGDPLPWGDYVSPHGAMLYAECYHYRAAVVGEALQAGQDTRHFQAVTTLLGEMDRRIQYFQNGSIEGFHRDTEKMATQILARTSVSDDRDADARDLLALLVHEGLLSLRSAEPSRTLLRDVSRCLRATDAREELAEVLESSKEVDELFAPDERLGEIIVRMTGGG
jgi:hypothetical protein